MISTTLAGDRPSAVYAYIDPTHEVEAKGVVASAPGRGWDSFNATTFVVAPSGFATIGSAPRTSVNETGRFPKGISSGADTCTVDSQTKVLGNTSPAPGDIVARSFVAPNGESAKAVGSGPLQVLVDFRAAGFVDSVIRHDSGDDKARRAPETLHHAKARLGRHHEKFRIVTN